MAKVRQSKRAKRSLASAVVLGVLGLVVGIITLVTPAPEVSAVPAPNGYYYKDSNWQYGPFASSDPSHIAYTGGPGNDYLSGGFLIRTSVRANTQRDSTDELAATSVVSRSASLSGINGARAYMPEFGGGDIQVVCETPDYLGNYCTIPAKTYTITMEWTFHGYEAPCYYGWLYWTGPGGRPPLSDCTQKDVSATVTRTVVAGDPTASTTTTTPGLPTAAFEYTASPTDRYELSFESTSTDPQDPPEDLTYQWTFGDGQTSAERNPVHRFEHAGTYDVSLQVTDKGGNTASTTRVVTIEPGLTVNSTGDSGATDATTKGCDTGQKVDGDPECTLRAAIQVANAKGGGEIDFAIDGGGIPTITPAAPLPAVTASTTIDGTTQDGGWVEVHGSGERVVELQSGTSVVTGLVLRGGADQITVKGGTGHTIRGNRLGTNAGGTTADAASDRGAFLYGGTGTHVEGNTVGVTELGIGVATAATGTVIEGNTIGVTEDGSASLGDLVAAIVVNAPGAQVTGNVVQGTSVGVELLRAAASNATVTDNVIGLRSDGTAAFADQGYGIRSDGAPGATITGNRISSELAGIVLTGSDQTTTGPDGLELTSPDDEPASKPATGAKATVSDNDIGLLANGTAAPENTEGIIVWAGMTEATITGNRLGGLRRTGIRLLGGSKHRVTGNVIGGDPDAGTPAPVHDGIEITDASDVVIGGVGPAANTIVHTDGGIDALEASTGLRIEANRLAAPNPESEGGGIEVGEGSAGAVVIGNRIVGGSTGIWSGAADAQLTGNQALAQSDVGIESEGDKTTISGSVIVAGQDGIRAEGDDVTITQNRIGLEDGSDEVTGNGGTGLTIEGGKAVVTKNVIAGTGGQGIKVAGGTATLRSNRVWKTDGDAIDVAGGPDAPELAAAARSGSGTDTRTTLLMNGLPEGDAGTIEVFANSSCGSSEAEFLMDINRKKSATETARIIQIKGASTRDHFTVTYTDEDGKTSELSDCVDAQAYADGDGDGSIDPFDEIFGSAGNASAGVFATDNEKLVLALVSPFDPVSGEGGGDLEDLRFISDPDPSGHPAGWSAPYGVMRFRISGLEPGGRTALSLAVLDPSDPFPATTGYWKYGPKTPGAADSWWNFAYEEESGTGALVTDAADIPGIGITRVLGLKLGDGLRGDTDGGANGTITDPGAPVLGAPDEPEVPATTSTTTTPTGTTTTTTETTTTTGGGTTPTTAAPATGGSGGTDSTPTGTLPRTGGDQSGLVTGALCLMALGFGLVLTTRRRTTGR